MFGQVANITTLMSEYTSDNRLSRSDKSYPLLLPDISEQIRTRTKEYYTEDKMHSVEDKSQDRGGSTLGESCEPDRARIGATWTQTMLPAMCPAHSLRKVELFKGDSLGKTKSPLCRQCAMRKTEGEIWYSRVAILLKCTDQNYHSCSRREDGK